MTCVIDYSEAERVVSLDGTDFNARDLKVDRTSSENGDPPTGCVWFAIKSKLHDKTNVVWSTK